MPSQDESRYRCERFSPNRARITSISSSAYRAGVSACGGGNAWSFTRTRNAASVPSARSSRSMVRPSVPTSMPSSPSLSSFAGRTTS